MTSTPTFECLQLDLDGGLATLTLDRPDRGNAMDPQLSRELRDAAMFLTYEPAVRAVLLKANGKLFSGGGDLATFAGSGPAELPAIVDSMTVDLHAAIARLAKMDAPLVAAVTGSAGGAGMSLVAACDLVIAGRSARFTMGYTKAGLVPDGTSSFFLSRVVGLRRALDLVLTNRVLSAEEAEDWGLVSRVVDDDAVISEATALARQLAQGPTKAFGLAKRTIYAGANSALEEAMERESAAIAVAAATTDAHEGIAAFLAKRAPAYQGR